MAKFISSKLLLRRFYQAFFVLINILVFGQTHTHFENITVNDGLPSNYIFSLSQDKKGIIWGGTDKGLIKYENGKWHTFTTDEGLPGNYVNQIFSDKNDGFLLYMSEYGVYYFDIHEEKILKKLPYFKRKSPLYFGYADIDSDYVLIKEKAKYKPNYYAFNIKTKQTVKVDSIHENQKDYISLKGKKLSGINVFNNNKEITYGKSKYKIIDGRGLLLIDENNRHVLISEQNGLETTYLSGFLINNEGDLLIPTMGQGILLLHKTNYKITYKIDNLDVTDIVYKAPYYYLLSNDYIYTVSENAITDRRYIEKGMLSLFIDGDYLYSGAFRSINRINLNNNSLQSTELLPFGLGVSTFFKNGKDIYFSTYGQGIIKLDNKLDQRLQNFPFDNIEKTFVLSNGFAMTSYQSGVYFTDKNFKVQKFLNKSNGLRSNFVTHVFEDGKRVWIGMKNNLAYLEDNKLYQFQNNSQLANAGMILSIFRDKSKTLWIIGEYGIYKMVKNDLLNVASLNILNDTNKRITKSIYIPEKNYLLVTTRNELSAIDLGLLMVHDELSVPEFVGAEVDGKKIVRNENRLTVPDNYRTFELIFESVDNTLLSKNRLQYRLNDGEWTNFSNANKQRFSRLNYGKYLLKVRSQSESGKVINYPNDIRFRILPPIYLRWWFVSLFLALIALTAWLVSNKITSDKYNRKMQEILVEENLVKERKRISRDLHDNIGAYTTSLISKIDALKEEHIGSDKELRDLSENAQNILTLLRQTIWVLGSKNTSVENYFDSMKNYAIKYFSSYPNIKLEINEDINDNFAIESTKAVSMFRILQEALQNVVKHSEASSVQLLLKANKNIMIEIKDNGKGFDVNAPSSGFGILNMKERSKESEINIEINSGNEGTSIKLLG